MIFCWHLFCGFLIIIKSRNISPLDIFSPERFLNFFFTLWRGGISVSLQDTHRRKNKCCCCRGKALICCVDFDGPYFSIKSDTDTIKSSGRQLRFKEFIVQYRFMKIWYILMIIWNRFCREHSFKLVVKFGIYSVYLMRFH